MKRLIYNFIEQSAENLGLCCQMPSLKSKYACGCIPAYSGVFTLQESYSTPLWRTWRTAKNLDLRALILVLLLQPEKMLLLIFCNSTQKWRFMSDQVSFW